MDKGLSAAGMLKAPAQLDEEEEPEKEAIEEKPEKVEKLDKPEKSQKHSINAIDLSSMGQNMKSFSQIQNQIDILQNLLPKITDVG